MDADVVGWLIFGVCVVAAFLLVCFCALCELASVGMLPIWFYGKPRCPDCHQRATIEKISEKQFEEVYGLVGPMTYVHTKPVRFSCSHCGKTQVTRV